MTTPLEDENEGLNKVRFTLHRFLQNSYILGRIMWIYSIPNFAKIGQQIWTVWVQNNLRAQ